MKTDFEVDIDSIVANRPETSPAVLTGSIGAIASQPAHIDATAPIASAEYYKLYSLHSTEARNPRLPRPPGVEAFSRDQRVSIDAASIAVQLGRRASRAVVSQLRNTGPPQAPDDLVGEVAPALRHDVRSGDCYVAPGTETKWWRDSDNIVRNVFECLSDTADRQGVAAFSAVCSKWQRVALDGLVAHGSSSTHLNDISVRHAPRVAARPAATAIAGKLSHRLQRIRDSSAGRIQRQFRRYRATSAAQRTLALLHLVKHEAHHPHQPQLIECEQTTPLGFLFELAVEYEYQLQVSNMANRIVSEARQREGLTTGRGADSDETQPPVWVRRGSLNTSEVEELYGAVHANYDSGFAHFATPCDIPVLQTFLCGAANAETFTDRIHSLLSGNTDAQWQEKSFLRDLYGSPSLVTSVERRESHEITDEQRGTTVPASLKYVREPPPSIDRITAHQELLLAADTVDPTWFGPGVTKDVLLRAANEESARAAATSPGKGSNTSTNSTAGATSAATSSELSVATVSDMRPDRHLAIPPLSEAPKPPQSYLDSIIPPPMPPAESIAEFKWPEKLDPAFRQATELEYDDDPELKFHGSSSDEDSNTEFGDNEAPATVDSRRFSVEHNIQRFNLKDQRRREEMMKRLESIYGTAGTARDTVDSNPITDDVDCSLLRGGKAHQHGMDPTMCTICELDAVKVHRCACGGWVHHDCAYSTTPLKCCSTCS